MATPLTDSINALTRYANETTGATDTTLSDAVESLVAGYGGGGDSCLWRTVTLEESHEADNIGNALYWGSFLDIASQTDLDEYTYVAVFTNNRPSNMTYCTNLISYVSVSGTIKCSSIRNDWSNTMNQYNAGRSLWASAGAIINIYKIKIAS